MTMSNTRLDELTDKAAAIADLLPPLMLSGSGEFYEQGAPDEAMPRSEGLENWYRASELARELATALHDEPRRGSRAGQTPSE